MGKDASVPGQRTYDGPFSLFYFLAWFGSVILLLFKPRNCSFSLIDRIYSYPGSFAIGVPEGFAGHTAIRFIVPDTYLSHVHFKSLKCQMAASRAAFPRESAAAVVGASPTREGGRWMIAMEVLR